MLVVAKDSSLLLLADLALVTSPLLVLELLSFHLLCDRLELVLISVVDGAPDRVE